MGVGCFMPTKYVVDHSKITRPPTHPGIIFSDGIMPELRKTRTIGEIATLLGVSRQTLYRLMAGQGPITPDMAVRLGKLVGNGPNLWIRLQGNYDIWESAKRLEKEIKKDRKSV